MNTYINHVKDISESDFKSEKIPMHLHDELKSGTEIEFNDTTIFYHSEETLKFFEKSVIPLLVKQTLDLLDFELSDLIDIRIINKYGLQIKAEDTLTSKQINSLKSHVNILSININKNSNNGFYIEAWVQDPLKRIWQICPGHYSEGWHHIDDIFYKMGAEYAQINNIKINYYGKDGMC
jgi:hypothetical protein